MLFVAAAVWNRGVPTGTSLFETEWGAYINTTCLGVRNWLVSWQDFLWLLFSLLLWFEVRYIIDKKSTTCSAFVSIWVTIFRRNCWDPHCAPWIASGWKRSFGHETCPSSNVTVTTVPPCQPEICLSSHQKMTFWGWEIFFFFYDSIKPVRLIYVKHIENL